MNNQNAWRIIPVKFFSKSDPENDFRRYLSKNVDAQLTTTDIKERHFVLM